MSLGPAFRDAYRTLVARPSDVLPFYFGGLAVPAVVRTIPFLGIFVAYLLVAGTGRLDDLQAVLEDAAPIAIDDAGTTAGIDQDALDAAIDQVLTNDILAVLAVSGLLAVIAVLVVDAAISAGQVHGVYAALRDRAGIRPAVDGAFRHASTFVGLTLVEFLAWVIAIAFVALLTVVSVLLGFLFGMVAAVVLIAVRLVFAFARPAAVVDDVGLVGAIRGGARHVGERPVEAVGYGLFVILLLVAVGVLNLVLSFSGAELVATLVSLLAMRPLLDLTKTRLYATGSEAGTLSIPPRPQQAHTARLRSELGRGWSELVAFTRDHLGLVAASTIVFVASVWVGLVAAQGIDHIFEASIERRLQDISVLGFFLGLAANNWSVAVAQSLSGFLFGIPTIVSLVFNGLNIGAIYQIEVAPDLLIAFVVPHGLVEIPSLLLSGALGFYLGIVGVDYVRGTASREDLADAIEHAYYVLLGLALLFLVAAAIEAFFSPFYWRYLGIA